MEGSEQGSCMKHHNEYFHIEIKHNLAIFQSKKQLNSLPYAFLLSADFFSKSTFLKYSFGNEQDTFILA